MFACYPVRRLEAEVLIDALCRITGTGESYSSPIPEPFTFMPESAATIDLADGSITSPFLELFGRPPRDTGLESERNNRTGRPAAPPAELDACAEQDREEQAPEQTCCKTPQEPAAAGRAPSIWRSCRVRRRRPRQESRMAHRGEGKPGAKQAVDDLAWALINTKEFLYRH